MEKDTQQELERLEKELLEEAETLREEDLLTDADLANVFEGLAEPAELDDAAVYSNYESDYDDALQEFADQEDKPVFGDKLTIGLMLAACGLCLGIIGIMVYWITAYL